ncbi:MULTISPECIES: HAD-IA family hydrolase [unclassified Rhodococcus (in: high G+C Gram-positive bacteria)]|uniref:HAD-IA family hydrolase n=1 Tax=unclassified Rhodococcus (in: high G+C Gram-positive bacteria) TaxID=192944 RepID=UPI0003155198|nr:HAD-IA family hydrolase [Rhodococcus sp. DK17]
MTSLSTSLSSAPSALSAPIVLFDLDGTLTDSAPGIHAGFRHALATIGQPEPTDEMIDAVIGPPMIDTFRSMGLDEDVVRQAVAAYFERYDSVGWAENAVFDGVEKVLIDARDSGRRLAVATSKSERFAIRILEHFELAQYFEFIGGASDDGSRRAKSDVIAHSLRNLGVTATEGATPDVLMVGDRDHDVLGAAHWGIPAVFVEWGYGFPAEAERAHTTAQTVAHLGKMLDAAA